MVKAEPPIHYLVNDWQMPWDTLDVLIGGKSSIDLSSLKITTLDEAKQFVRRYGFDPGDIEDQRLIHAMIIEALNFIAKKLMPKEWAKGHRPPPELLLCDDPCQFILWASQKPARTNKLQAWACAVLRVLHTVSHIEDVKRITNMDDARQQIMNRFFQYIHRDDKGCLWLGEGEERVELDKIESKPFKTRDSIILKLLHKPANIAETIYDLMGIRFVTKHLADTIRVAKYMIKFDMVSFPNTHPTRARNTLVDLDYFKQQLESLINKAHLGAISDVDFNNLVAQLEDFRDPTQRINPHSSHYYRSIQLTSRQLVRIPSPAFSWLEKFKNHESRSQLSEKALSVLDELTNLIEGWSNVQRDRQDLVFFPFEVQIMDRNAYMQNQYGEASYDRYKQSQVKAARKRVLPRVLATI